MYVDEYHDCIYYLDMRGSLMEKKIIDEEETNQEDGNIIYENTTVKFTKRIYFHK